MPHQASRREQIDNALLRRYHQDGDLQAREELTRRCLPLVRSIARRYQARGQDIDELTQAGLLGLAKAIERYDVTSGHRFVSFAVPNIQGEIRRHFRDCTWAVHVPRSLQELRSRVERARSEMQQTTEREATADDLARKLRVRVDDVRDAQSAGRSYRAESLDALRAPGDQAAEAVLDPGYDRVEDADLIARAMEGLGARDRQVVRWRFQDGLLQREIAERLGVSQMQVSRILKDALVRMGEQSSTTRTSRRGRQPRALGTRGRATLTG